MMEKYNVDGMMDWLRMDSWNDGPIKLWNYGIMKWCNYGMI